MEKTSPCASCSEVFEAEWPEVLAFYCDGIPEGMRCLIETQRLKHPRGTQHMCTEGPLPGCPKLDEILEKRRLDEEKDRPYPQGCAKARERLERSLHVIANDH